MWACRQRYFILFVDFNGQWQFKATFTSTRLLTNPDWAYSAAILAKALHSQSVYCMQYSCAKRSTVTLAKTFKRDTGNQIGRRSVRWADSTQPISRRFHVTIKSQSLLLALRGKPSLGSHSSDTAAAGTVPCSSEQQSAECLLPLPLCSTRWSELTAPNALVKRVF